jgi:putative Ca2+/H+ antiporter (TMEM165/GDT1 family)
MTLATRYRPLPIVIASEAAFALLNILGIVFGAMGAQWLPVWIVVALLFFIMFGCIALYEAVTQFALI